MGEGAGVGVGVGTRPAWAWAWAWVWAGGRGRGCGRAGGRACACAWMRTGVVRAASVLAHMQASWDWQTALPALAPTVYSDNAFA